MKQSSFFENTIPTEWISWQAFCKLKEHKRIRTDFSASNPLEVTTYAAIK